MTTLIGGYQRYVAANFQRLHNEYGMEHVTIIHMPNHGECFEQFKTVAALQDECRTLQEDAESFFSLLQLSQGFSRLLCP